MYETKAQADKRRREYQSGNAQNYMRDKLKRLRAQSPDGWRDLARKAAADKYRRPIGGPNAKFGKRQNLQWLEYGLDAFRHEWADKCEGVRIDHTGWFDSEYQEETYRGIVLATTRGTFLAGMCHGAESRKRGGWQSVCGNDSAVIVETGYSYSTQAEAARAADHIAEHMAEAEREYNAQANAGIQASELRAEINETRAETLASLAELRQARKALARDSAAFPHLCEQLRRDARAAVRDIKRKRAKIAELVESFGDSAAFREHFPA